MASASLINAVNFTNSPKCILHPKRDYFSVNTSYSTKPKPLKRQMRSKHSRMTPVAAGNEENDFSDPRWKLEFQEDFQSRFNLPHLKDVLPVIPRPTTFSLKTRHAELVNGANVLEDRKNGYVNEEDRALLKVIKYSSVTSAGAECIDPDCSWIEQWVHRAGPREEIYFEPGEVKAGIVTCGGLCPGLNDVIRQIVFTLELYGVKKIVGIQYGYRGFFDPALPEIELSREVVQNINLAGGSLLGVSRGGADCWDFQDLRNINNK